MDWRLKALAFRVLEIPGGDRIHYLLQRHVTRNWPRQTVTLDALAQIAQAGFAIQPSDDAQLVPIGQDVSFALVKPDRVVAAAPRPLAEIREAVAAAFIRDRQLQAARKAAVAILADVNKGTPIADAMKKTGLALPELKPLDAVRG